MAAMIVGLLCLGFTPHDTEAAKFKNNININNNNDIAKQLENKVVTLFDTMHSHKVTMKRKNIEVRVKSDDDRNIMTFSEIKNTNIHPDEFKTFFEEFKTDFPKINSMVKFVKPLQKCGRHNREGVKSVLKFPFPLNDRIMVHWKYIKLHRNPNEHMLFLSEQDNDILLQNHYSKNERKKFCLAKTYLCAYWIKPIYDKKNTKNIIGSSIQYLFSGDTGGNMPKSVQNMVGPKSAFDSIHGLLQHIKKQKK